MLRELIQPKTQPKPCYAIKYNTDDEAYAQINLKGLSALRAIARDFLAFWLCWGLVIYGLYRCYEESVSDYWLWGAAIIAPWLLYPLIYLILTWILAQRKTISLTHEHLRFKRHVLPKVIDRDLPIHFALDKHVLEAWEKRRFANKLQKDRIKRKVRYRKPYFQDSFHLTAIKQHQSHTLMTLYDERQANRNLGILNAAKDELEGMLGIGKGVSSKPEQEWRDQAGNLPG